MLNGVTNYTWTKFDGPDVLFGAEAENFLPGSGSYKRAGLPQAVRQQGMYGLLKQYLFGYCI